MPMKKMPPSPLLLVGAFCVAVLSAPTFAQDSATRTIELRTVQLTLPAEAVLEATRQATVATQVSGRIVEVKVEAGQRVSESSLPEPAGFEGVGYREERIDSRLEGIASQKP